VYVVVCGGRFDVTHYDNGQRRRGRSRRRLHAISVLCPRTLHTSPQRQSGGSAAAAQRLRKLSRKIEIQIQIRGPQINTRQSAALTFCLPLASAFWLCLANGHSGAKGMKYLSNLNLF